MPYTPFADQHHSRRHRNTAQAVAGYPTIPLHERHSDAVHAAGHSGTTGGTMARALRMDATGLWVVHLGGELAEIGGRCYWDTLGDLTAAAKRAGIPLSDLTIHTGADA